MKLRRSKILWITILFFSFIPFMMGLMFFIQKHPEISAKLGIIGTKAMMLRFGNADWPAYFGFLTQGMAAIGLIGFGFVTSWVFGREYSDRTAKDILALPVSRSLIVLSKFIVVVIWSILLIFVYVATGLIFGQLFAISGWSGEMIHQNAYTFIVTSLLTVLLCTPVAFFACYGRGYLLPMSVVILTLLIANFTGLLGWGPYFPWAIPGLFSIPAGSEGMQLSVVSYIILVLTSILGFFGTVIWWHFADQK
jgi:ABC-type transport system involved in multi-copper enzyme maturation permease subunit